MLEGFFLCQFELEQGVDGHIKFIHYQLISEKYYEDFDAFVGFTLSNGPSLGAEQKDAGNFSRVGELQRIAPVLQFQIQLKKELSSEES